MIIQNADNWFARCDKTMQQIRGRSPGREEFTKYAVGNEFLKWVEAVEDNPEADAALNAQAVGRAALANNWQGQLNALSEQLKVQADNINKQNQTITELTQALEDKQKTGSEKQAVLNEAITTLSQTTANLETSHDIIKDASTVPARQVEVTPEATKTGWFVGLLAAVLKKKK